MQQTTFSGVVDEDDPLQLEQKSISSKKETFKHIDEIPSSFVPSYSKTFESVSPNSPTGGNVSKRVFSPNEPTNIISSISSDSDQYGYDDAEQEKDFKAGDEVEALLCIPLLQCRLETGSISEYFEKNPSISGIFMF